MKTLNIDGLTIFEIKQLVQQGGKFVAFPYTVSVILKTFRKTSNIYFIRPNESSFKYSLYFFFLNLSIGWWSIPWGPVYTLKSLYYHIIGGKDITVKVLNDLDKNNPVYRPNIHYLRYK